MVDDVRDITETAESKASTEALDRARLARERREAEQRKRLEELRAHAAAAQAQREKREEERRKRQAEQRARDEDRRQQVEERKRAIWEASISRREALLQREKERSERLERARAARSSPRPAFAFGSSTPRLLEPLDSGGFFYAARSTNPIDQMNFFESLAASTSNVMFASAPLTRRASALQLDSSDTDNKDESERAERTERGERAGAPPLWSSVARRRTDLVPTLPAPRPGRAYSMTRLDRIPSQRPLHSASPSMHHLNRTQTRSGETTPGSRPGSALSNVAAAGVVRRAASAPRKPRPASIAGTGVNTPTPRGGGVETGGGSLATTPSVSRDGSVVASDTPRRPAPRRARPASVHLASASPSAHFASASASTGPARTSPAIAPGEGKPPVHRKPKPSKEHEKGRKSQSPPPQPPPPPPPPQPPRDTRDTRTVTEEPVVDKDLAEIQQKSPASLDKSSVSAAEVTQKLEALQIYSGEETLQHVENKVIENIENVEVKLETKPEPAIEEFMTEQKPIEVQKPIEKKEEIKEEKKESSQEKTEDNEMTASMTARRITTEEQAKAALAERRRRAREELERQAELERQRLQREAEEEAERQRQEEERQRREEEEARELAELQRKMEEEKLRKAIEAQQQLEREEADRKVREEIERQARLKEEEEKKKAAEEAEKLRREEAEREEKERLVRKQRVEAIMARTRLRKAEEDKKNHESKAQLIQSAGGAPAAPSPAAPSPSAAAPSDAAGPDNGNTNDTSVGDLLGLTPSQPSEALAQEESQQNAAPVTAEPSSHEQHAINNGNVTTDLLGLSEQNNTEDKSSEQTATITKTMDNLPTNAPTLETNNGNVQTSTTNVGHISANFIQTERMSEQNNQKMEVQKLIDDDFTTHNGHGHNHPLTLQNAI